MSYISAIKQGEKVFVWEKDENNKRRMVSYDAPYYFYIESKAGDYKSLDDKTLSRFDFNDGQEFYNAKKQCVEHAFTMYESDIPPELKVLSDNYYGVPAPKINVTMYDIEVDYDTSVGFSSPSNPYAPVNAIAMMHMHKNKMIVIAIPPDNANCEVPALGVAGDDYIQKMNDITPIIEGVDIEISFVQTEKQLLRRFLDEIEDTDIICGWNNSGFDDPYMGKRIEKVLGKRYLKRLCFPEAPAPKWRDIEIYGKEQPVIDLFGRVSLDYLTLFKKYMVENQASYKLDSIADKFLRTDGEPDMPKLEYQGSLADLYRNDFNYFIRYNIRDTEILYGFESKLKYVALANDMVHISTGQFTHVAGTIKLAELAVMNYCHHDLDNVVVNDKPEADWGGEKIQGAIVLDPVMGMHEWLSSVDLNSLYPSAIRACNISPETKIGQFLREESAFEAIRDETDDNLTFQYVSGKTETATAAEWREILLDRKHCISGFGTVFTIEYKGVIPSILEHWYASRKTYQKAMNEAKQAYGLILSEYKDGTRKKGKVNRKGVMMSKEDAIEYDQLVETADYNDRLQYVYKIKLNSFYGALANQHFKFGDRALGESTTALGRHIVTHQHRKVNELLTGEYDEHGEGIIYGDSVAGDTIINTNKGDIPIESLFTQVDEIKNGKEYCNLSGYESLTFNELPQINEYRKVPYVVRHAVNKKMYRVWFGNQRHVDVTEDHSLIGYANTRSKTPGRLVNVKANDLGKDGINSVLLSSNSARRDSEIIETDYPEELYILLGLILGDGWASDVSNSSVELSVGKNDIDEIIKTVINPLIDAGWIKSIGRKTNDHDIRLHSAKLRKFIMGNLYQHGTKRIPMWMFTDSNKNIGLFLNGYFTADGTVLKGMPRLTSSNHENILGVNKLMTHIGVASNYWMDSTINSYKGKSSGTYQTVLDVYDSVRFEQRVGFSLSRKHDEITIEYSRRKEHLMGQNGYALIAPTLIEEIDALEYVYDIEVYGTHKFYGNGILLHNTDSTYFHTFTDNTKDAREVGDAIADEVNKSFIPWMQETFLVDKERAEIIQCGREIVADRGIFVMKKKYMLHLTDLDGYDADKLKVMGLDTKRTTIPKPISERLETFIARLLKGESWDDIEQDIVDYKDEILEGDKILEIGIPSGINKLEAYTREYQLDKKTRLPGHVSASILYNRMREENEDHVSPAITSGMKIKRFYLKKPYERFKAIALPTDMTAFEIPDWFWEFDIDRDMHIEKLVDGPINNVIKAIGEESPTKQSMKFKSLFD